MNAAYRRSLSNVIPGYSRNAMLQLIVITGGAFVTFFLMILLMQQFGNFPKTWTGAQRYAEARETITAVVALPQLQAFPAKFWTLFTYGWFQEGFWAWLSTAIWIYCWGSVVQNLVGYRQVIPLFVYGLLGGGVFFLVAQTIPGVRPVAILMGSAGGVMALAVAAFSLAPGFRFYLGPTFSIPIAIVFIIFSVLMVMSTDLHPVLLLSLAGGALAGYLYVRALQRGNRPGEWAYDLAGRVENTMTPRNMRKGRKDVPLRRVYPAATTRRGLSQRRVDELLEKIHQKGYQSLTEEEKEILLQASKEAE